MNDLAIQELRFIQAKIVIMNARAIVSAESFRELKEATDRAGESMAALSEIIEQVQRPSPAPPSNEFPGERYDE